jgi:hypothetical protein
MFFMSMFFVSIFLVGFAVHDHFLLFNHNRLCAYCYSCQRYSKKDCHKNSQYLFHSPRWLFHHLFHSFIIKINNF